MLQITESATGKLLALVEGEPWHVKEGASGAFVHCGKGEATGVAVGGVAYKLADVALREIDGAEIVFRNHQELAKAASGVAAVSDAVAELDGDVSAQLDGLKAAICELDEEMSANG